MTSPHLTEAPDRIPGRTVGWLIAGTVAVILACAAIVALLLAPRVAGGGRTDRGPAPSTSPAEPFSPGTAGEHAQALRRAALDRWSWADRDRRIVRLPVDVAIDRYLRARGGR
ncbi:MAG TPA: hypothetical protein VHE35_22265 [Kofleriaceae bacterium]|nr:hypothetical protein [Kofleriaceae bacterium]